MKTLIITAAPHSTSFTHKIAESYKKGVLNKGNEVEIIDLYDEKYSQKFLKFENNREMPEDNVKNEIQAKMKESDEYVFVFPVWWGSCPAIMKNFFDTNLSSGFAFEYGKDGMKKLLTDKKARVFCTSDAPGFIYKIPFISGIMIKKYFKTAILNFCGIKLVDFELFGNLRGINEEKRKDILLDIENRA